MTTHEIQIILNSIAIMCLAIAIFYVNLQIKNLFKLQSLIQRRNLDLIERVQELENKT